MRHPWSLRIIIIALVFLLIIVNLLAVRYSWYWRFSFIDIPVHILGGLTVTLASIWLIYLRNSFAGRIRSVDEWNIRAVSCAVAVLIGVIWEGYEYYFNDIFTYAGLWSLDTIGDMASNMAGWRLGVWIIERFFTDS